jgi:hypothetical protein
MSSLDDCQSARRVVGYSDERLAAIRDRVRELETNYASVESVSGIQSGYLSNVTAHPRPKRMALHVCFLILTALSLQIELTLSPDFERFACRLERRRLVRRPMLPAGRVKEFPLDFFHYIPRLGNEARSRKLARMALPQMHRLPRLSRQSPEFALRDALITARQ